MCMPRYAPIHSPFEQREGLVQRQGLEGNSSVERKQNLWAKPAPQVSRSGEANVEISKAGIFGQREVGIELTNALCHAADRGLHVDNEGADLEEYPRFFEPGPKL